MSPPSETTQKAVGQPDDPNQQFELSPDLVTLTNARPVEAEAIRAMRTYILARHLDDGRRGLAVCAATRGAGCTFTAANLAVALAQTGVKTLLIDGDLRNPGVENLIRPLGGAEGLKQCLTERLNARDVIQPEVLQNLSVLYAGGAEEHAQELLGSEPFKVLIDQCLRDFEFTIVDTPPANECADARRIGTVVGYSALVARRNVSLLGELSNLASQLQSDGSVVIGTVLNEV
jgi:capsular exopolysaccharide synthesis family protein